MDYAGGIPKEGDKFNFENLNFTITKTNDHRILYARVQVEAGESVEK